MWLIQVCNMDVSLLAVDVREREWYCPGLAVDTSIPCKQQLVYDPVIGRPTEQYLQLQKK